MSNTKVQKAFVYDGKVFASMAEVNDFIRRPKITEALNKLTDKNDELVAWLLDNQETVESAFEIGTIRRVTKSEKAKLDKAVEALKEVGADHPKLAFLVEHADAMASSFRWPTVQRMTEEEKATAARNTLTAAADDADLAEYILANKDAILECYKAGIEKRPVNEKAKAGLADYQARRAAEKAAKEAAAGATA